MAVSRSAGARWRRRSGVVVAVSGVLLVACSTTRPVGGDPTVTTPTFSADEAGVRASLSRYLATPGRDLNTWAAPQSEADCASRRIVDRLGSPRLLALGYDPNRAALALPYTPAEEEDVVQIVNTCIDLSAGLLELVGAYGKVQVASASCFATKVSEAGLTRDVARALVRGRQLDLQAQDRRVAQGLLEAMNRCFDPQKDLVPASPRTPFPGLDPSTTVPAGSGGN